MMTFLPRQAALHVPRTLPFFIVPVRQEIALLAALYNMAVESFTP
jgi:hypothetical protein